MAKTNSLPYGKEDFDKFVEEHKQVSDCPLSMEDRAKEAVDFVDDWARSTLSITTTISASDKKGFENRLKNFHSCFDDFAECLEPMRADSPNLFDVMYRHIYLLIRASVLVGSAGAVSEEARSFHLAPIKQGAQRGGKKSAEIHRQKIEAGWKSIARPMVKQIRDEHPDWSQDDVVDDIRAGWKHAEPEAARSRHNEEICVGHGKRR
jgi:hypothetical protein